MLRTFSILLIAAIAMGVAIKMHPVHGQVSSQALPVSVAITIYRPVQTSNGISIVPQTGTNPAYGIASMSGAAGTVANVVKYGDYPCEFDAPPTLGNTAVPLNGFCHDSGVTSDIAIPNTSGVIGKIMKMRPDLGPNFAEVTIGFPGRRGTMVDATSFGPNVAPVATSNDYNDLINQPAMMTSAQAANAAPVHSVAGRIGNVVITSADLADFATAVQTDQIPAPVTKVAGRTGAVTLTAADVSGLATVATSGSYTDLSNKPTLTTGPQGNPGTAATVSVGTTTTGTAAVTNSGTSSAAILNFTVPQGMAGQNGTNAANPAFTASSTGLAAGASPTVTLTGTYPAQNLAFGIPAGAAGTNGTNGAAGQNGTNAANPSFTASASSVAAGGAPTVTLSGTYPALNLALGIPTGATGAASTVPGPQGAIGPTGASGIGPFSAPSASWPSWLVPTVTNASTTPSLAVTASAIPNSALANSTVAVNGQTCTLGGTCSIAFPVTYYTPAGTALSGVKHVVSGPVTTSSAGAWSVAFSAVGCTAVRSANVSVISPTGTLATQQYTPYIQTLNTTTISGVVYSGAVLSILGATLVPITVATTVYVDLSCT